MGTVFWITGLSGVGKTTIGTLLLQKLRNTGRPAVLLDGDRLRRILGKETGYSQPERLDLARTYARLCKELSEQGIDIVCATISLFHEVHEWNRANIPHYLEIFVRAPVGELSGRKAAQGVHLPANNVVGHDITPEEPLQPHLTIENWGEFKPEHAIETILGVEHDQYFKAA
jgi:cytidine diphosphoramidate kinase